MDKMKGRTESPKMRRNSDERAVITAVNLSNVEGQIREVKPSQGTHLLTPQGHQSDISADSVNLNHPRLKSKDKIRNIESEEEQEDFGMSQFKKILEDFRNTLKDDMLVHGDSKFPTQESSNVNKNTKSKLSKTNVQGDEKFYDIKKKKRQKRLSLLGNGDALKKKETVYEIRQRGIKLNAAVQESTTPRPNNLSEAASAASARWDTRLQQAQPKDIEEDTANVEGGEACKKTLPNQEIQTLQVSSDSGYNDSHVNSLEPTQIDDRSIEDSLVKDSFVTDDKESSLRPGTSQKDDKNSEKSATEKKIMEHFSSPILISTTSDNQTSEQNPLTKSMQENLNTASDSTKSVFSKDSEITTAQICRNDLKTEYRQAELTTASHLSTTLLPQNKDKIVPESDKNDVSKKDEIESDAIGTNDTTQFSDACLDKTGDHEQKTMPNEQIKNQHRNNVELLSDTELQNCMSKAESQSEIQSDPLVKEKSTIGHDIRSNVTLADEFKAQKGILGHNIVEDACSSEESMSISVTAHDLMNIHFDISETETPSDIHVYIVLSSAHKISMKLRDSELTENETIVSNSDKNRSDSAVSIQNGFRINGDCDFQQAQAQTRAERRKKENDVQMEFGDDGLYIKTTNIKDSNVSGLPPIQQQLVQQPQQQQQQQHYQQSQMSQQQLPLYGTQHHLPAYGTHYDNGDGVAEAYPDFSSGRYITTNSYLSNDITSQPVFTGHHSGSGDLQITHQNGPHHLPSNHSSAPYSDIYTQINNDIISTGSTLDLQISRRRDGRDHTNYVLPPYLDQNKSQKGRQDPASHTNTYTSANENLAVDGPPGLPLPNHLNAEGRDRGLKLVVLDKTDDEDDNVQDVGSVNYIHQMYNASASSEVFPLDRKAVDRDMYKQMYDPLAEPPTANRRPSTHAGVTSVANASGVEENKYSGIDNNVKQQPHGYPQTYPFALSVIDYDSESASLDTGRTTASLQQLHLHQQPPKNDKSLPAITYEQMPLQYGQPLPQIYNNSSNVKNGSESPIYSVSQIDYERFVSNPSQLDTVRVNVDEPSSNDSPPESNQAIGDFQRGVDSKTFLILPHTRATNSSQSIRDAGGQHGKVVGPGYKFQVNQYNVAKRASILNRAEQLLDARRGHFTDRSDSSDEVAELRRIDEDDEYEDDHQDQDSRRTPRHQTLRHLRNRRMRRRKKHVYDDSTSYNSSDDVLNTMRFHPRGPVSQTARRARLTAVNARINKHKRIRAARRQNLPPPAESDNDENSSGSDVPEPPMSFRPRHNDSSRYEEPILRETNDNSDVYHHHGQQVAGDAGAKGRRVMFFRNGDIHFKPKQVLINHKTYTNLEKLLVDLSSMVETSTGVKYIFSWPEGREIKSITEFENGKYYVCSSTNKLQGVDYGNGRESHWKGGKIDRNDNFLFQKDGKVHSPLRRPRVLTVVSNMYRDSREKLILNTNSQMNFEDILSDIAHMVNIPNPPVRALYTERKPHQKVESYSQLIRDFADHDNFLACGEEMVPLELATKFLDPGVDHAVKKTRRPPLSDPGQATEPIVSPSGRNMNDKNNNKQQGRVWRRKTDSVRVDINGKTREFFPPTLPDADDNGMKPGKKLKLDWVYGFRGRDVKQNLVVLPSTGELVYFVAAVVVLYDKKYCTQKHYLGHSEEITCLTIHPNGRFIATGQTAGKTPETGAHVRIWDGMSLSTYAVIGLGNFQQGVLCVNFSEKDSSIIVDKESTSGDLLMAIEDSDRHVLSLWEWQTEKMVARTTTTNEPVVSGCFYPFDESILVTYGKEHIHFWRIFWEKGRKIMRDKLSGNFKGEVPKFVTALCFSPTGDVITGDSSGAILVWSCDNSSIFSVNESLITQTKRAHKKTVSALCMLGDGTLLSGGRNEIKAWDSINNYSLVKERVLPESAGHVRSIVPVHMGGLDGSIYVATTRNKVLEGSLQLKFKFVIQGHVEELWAVESHPLEQTFISAGHDQAVAKWSTVSHAPVWRVTVENPCTSISIDPKGRLIALGTTAGKVIILNSYNGSQLTTLFSGSSQINALSFSPDGKQLAVGTFDGAIQIFYVQNEGRNFFRAQSSALKNNNVFIMHMDWSVDSRLLQAVLGDYEIVYWDITAMQKIKTAKSLRDVKWATHNCPISHSVIGPWQNLERGAVINIVSRSQYQDLMIVGDTKGRLRLYKWPCSTPKVAYRQTKVYSSNVTCATFTCDDSYLITSGGNDAALMQFSVLDPAQAR